MKGYGKQHIYSSLDGSWIWVQAGMHCECGNRVGRGKGMGTLSGVVGWVAQVGIKQQHSPYHKGINTVQSEYSPVSITCMQIRPQNIISAWSRPRHSTMQVSERLMQVLPVTCQVPFRTSPLIVIIDHVGLKGELSVIQEAIPFDLIVVEAYTLGGREGQVFPPITQILALWDRQCLGLNGGILHKHVANGVVCAAEGWKAKMGQTIKAKACTAANDASSKHKQNTKQALRLFCVCRDEWTAQERDAFFWTSLTATLIAADTRLHMTQNPHVCRDAWTWTAQEGAGLFVDFICSPDSLPHSYRHKTEHNSNPTHMQGYMNMNSSGGSWPFCGLHLQPWQPPSQPQT